MQILEYTTDDGASPFARWFDRLNAPAALKVRRALAQMEAGNFANTKSVGGGVRERIIDFGPGYRVYFGRAGDDLGDSSWGWYKETSTEGHRHGKDPLDTLQVGSDDKENSDGTNPKV